mmetsp:Transcript_59283/g.176088  ORF Transcript_59283/g.176088 Transcript_59283/m.176088 type:complete len:161 (+) Transcript_59283:151-633(+)
MHQHIQRREHRADALTVRRRRQRSAGRFDRCLEESMVCTAVGDGSVECTLEVTESLANNYGTLHGGAISTIVDVVGTLALLSVDPSRAGVSVEMSTSFCSAAKIGESLTLTGRTLRYGKSLGFTEIEVRKAASAEGAPPTLVATGRHTKMFPPPAAKSKM